MVPVQVTGLDGPALRVSVGIYHTCALMADGRIACWGDNDTGRLGAGTASESTSPVYVAGTDNYIAVAVSSWHTCAMTEAGEVQCWGTNSSGQLGDNTTSDHMLPAPVQGLAGPATAISVGESHSCALLQNRSVQCWGANQYSQMGDGSSPDRLTPVLVPLSAAQPVGLHIEDGGGGYRPTGPLVPELTTHIPTPLDISLDPGVVGANLLLAAVAMILLTITSELANRTLEANEAALRGRLRPANWVARLLQRIEAAAQIRLKRPGLVEAVKLGGIILIYGLTFSFLEPGWNIFTLTGFFLFFSLTLGGGIVGLADDVVQWLAARRWGVPASLHIHPANLLLAVTSTSASRLFSIIPGFMLGSPQAVQIDQSSLDRRRQRVLLWIGGLTLAVIGLFLWLSTILTTLIQRGDLPSLAGILIGGVESLFLSIFALAVQNAFLQMLAFPDSYGRALLRWNRWVWGGGLLGVTFVFYHTLVNPKGNLASAWASVNVRVFLITAGVLALLALGLWLFSKWQSRRSARQGMGLPGSPTSASQDIVLTPPPQAAPQPAPTSVSLPDAPSRAQPLLVPVHPLSPAFQPTGGEVSEQVQTLILGLKQAGSAARLAALQQMISLGKPAVKPLLSYLCQPDPWERLMAAAALGKLGDVRAIPALQQALNDPDSAVRQISQQALKELIIIAPPARKVSPPPPLSAPAFVKSTPADLPGVKAVPASPSVKSQPRRNLWLLPIGVLCIGSLAVLGIGGWLLRDRLPLLSNFFAPATPLPTQTTQLNSTPTLLPSPTATPTPQPTLTPTITPTFTPAWPGAFSEPILVAVADQPPSFTADFATGDGRVALWNCNGPECVVAEGVMRVSLEAAHIGLGGYLRARDFVLQVDLRPLATGTNTSAGIYFHHTQGIVDGVVFECLPDEAGWMFRYNSDSNNPVYASGGDQAIQAGAWVTMLVVTRGEQVAAYLNGEPVAYTLDTLSTGDYIYLFAIADSSDLVVEFDNLVFWDLAEVPGLPQE